MSDTHTYSSDVAFTPAVKVDSGPQGIARGLCPCRGARRLAHRDRRQPRGFLAQHQQPLFRDRLRRRAALHPASRRAEGLCQNPGQEHAGLRRLRRQPAIHHARQSLGKPQGAYLRDGLCPSPPGEDLGRGARGRRRSGAAAVADAAGLQGAARAGDPVSGLRPGTPTARSTSRRSSTPPMSPRRWPRAMRGSRNWRRKLAALKGEHRRRAECNHLRCMHSRGAVKRQAACRSGVQTNSG